MMADTFEMINSTWKYVTEVLTKQESDQASLYTNGKFWEAVEIISRHDLHNLIEEFFIDHFKSLLERQCVPEFWRELMTTPLTNVTKDVWFQVMQPLKRAVFKLHSDITTFQPQFKLLQDIRDRVGQRQDSQSFLGRVRPLYKGLLLARIPHDFNDVMTQFYTIAFDVFLQRETIKQTSENDNSMRCNACSSAVVECRCKDILEDFHDMNRKLCDLDILECLAGEALTDIIHLYIKRHVESICKGNFETQCLSPLEKWLDNVVVGWLEIIFFGKNECASERNNNKATDPTVQTFKGHLQHFLYETYATTRMNEMFHIIIEFPDSQPAIEDLKNCLEKTEFRSKLVESLRLALETRLLHPGVSTNDILIAYTSTIKTLTFLDPSGVILELVCEPVHKYLRTRQDTVRCIVSSLTDDTSGELADELVKGEPLILDDSYHSEDDDGDWQSWKPDPVDSDPEKYLKTRRTSDIISMLVNIYGSKELFVKEYRTLLANRILSQCKYDIQREIRYLELLKLRFGEANLHLCEVMLKDVADSKRINLRIHSEESDLLKDEEFPVNAMILSAQFWPAFRDGKIELPPKIQAALKKYTKIFETLKGNRTLNWQPHLGQVSVQIELKDRTLHLKVSPVHVTILIHFEEKSEWTLEELSCVMRASSSQLKQKITLWQSYGIIKEKSPGHYILIEEQKEKSNDVLVVEEEEEVESVMVSSRDQREEELQVFWSYIVGMLTNLESLPLERIHSMLKMFATQSTTANECNIQELRCFLQQKVREHKLLFSGGLYKLPKANN